MTSTTSTKTSEQALYIYVNDDLRDGLKSLKYQSRLNYRKLTRRMIEEVSANDLLEEAIRSYFLDRSPSWTDSNKINKIRVHQNDETLALASALAFRICGTGSISEVCRLIIRYYVDHSRVGGLMSTLQEAPKKIVAAAEMAATAVVKMERQRKRPSTSRRVSISMLRRSAFLRRWSRRCASSTWSSSVN